MITATAPAASPSSCTQADHDALRASPDAFFEATEGPGWLIPAYDPGESSYMIARCLRCGSSIGLCLFELRASFGGAS